MQILFEDKHIICAIKPTGVLSEDSRSACMPALLREHGFKTAAMALTEDSVNIDDPALMAEEKVAVILGTEGTGLSKATIKNSDYTVMIPMANEVDSLNVAAAGVIAFWQLTRRG